MSLLSPTRRSLVDIALFGAAIPLVAYALYLTFLIVPNERMMGPIQRIFYFHVGSAIACYVAFGTVLVCGMGYLATRNWLFDAISRSAGEVGFLFCTIVMITGMIWGHAAWNTWFRWEPRLVSFLLLWLIFLAFTILRAFGDQEKIAPHSAVLGILGAITVPLVVYSIKLLPSAAQLHPQVVENRGLRDPLFEQAMFVGMGAMVVFQFLLVWLRARIEITERLLESK